MDSAQHELILPPVDQENICLPLSINAVSRYWNVDIPLAEATEIAKKYPGIKGSILIEGIELAQKHGLSSLIINPTLADLKQFIDMNIPPIVILPGLGDVVQHASVISGYNNLENAIIHYIPSSDSSDTFRIGVIPEKQFDDLWSQDGRLCILIAPSEILSSIPNKENIDKSNRLCFLSERLNIQNDKSSIQTTLKEALELNPNNVTAMSLYAGMLNEQNSLDCVSFYKKCTTQNKQYYLAYRGLGNYYLKNAQYDKAEEYYTKAIEINPTRFGPIYKNRGLVRWHQSNIDGAKEDFKNYLTYTPMAQDRQNILDELAKL